MMKEFIQNFYKYLYHEDLVQIVEKECPVPPKTNSDKLYELAVSYIGKDPTPKNEQPNEYACVQSLTTILKKLVPEVPIMTYTPVFLDYMRKSPLFKQIYEFKRGAIIISPTNSGSARLVGHTGTIGEGNIMSNDSSTGLWSTKYTPVSWVQRYSQSGGLDLYLFELV